MSASQPACSKPRPALSRSATSWRGWPWRARSRRGAGATLHAAILAALETARPSTSTARGSRITPRRPATPTAVLRHGRAAAERGPATGRAPRGGRAVRARPAPRRRPCPRRPRRPALGVRARGAGERRVRGGDHGAEGGDRAAPVARRPAARGRAPGAADGALHVGGPQRGGRSGKPVRRRDAGGVAARPELATAYGIRRVRPDGRARQRRRRALGGEGGRARAAPGRAREPGARAHSDGRCVVTAGKIERGVGLLEQSLEHRARRTELEHRIAYGHWMLGSGLGEMYELERAERALRDHIAFAEERDLDSTYTRAWLACGARIPRALGGRRRARRGACSPRAPPPWPRSPPTSRSGACAPAAVTPARRARSTRPSPWPGRAGTSSACATCTPRGRRRPGSQATRSRRCAEARAVYPLVLEKRHPWFAGELAYWQWKAGRARPGARRGSPSRIDCRSRAARRPPPSAGAHAGVRMRRRARWPSPTPRTTSRRR